MQIRTKLESSKLCQIGLPDLLLGTLYTTCSIQYGGSLWKSRFQKNGVRWEIHMNSIQVVKVKLPSTLSRFYVGSYKQILEKVKMNANMETGILLDKITH